MNTYSTTAYVINPAIHHVVARLFFATAFLLLAVFGTAFGQRAVIDGELQAVLGSSTDPHLVIVTFDAEGIESRHLDLLQGLGIMNGQYLHSLPMAAVFATGSQIEQLASNPSVVSIWSNEQLSYFNDGSTEITGVNRTRTESSYMQRNNGMPLSGKGVTVLVNDSGVDGLHKDVEFGQNLIQNVQGLTNLHATSPLLPVTYTEDQLNTDTNSGHGTHVAGTVGGTGARSNGKYEGVAPGAALVGYGSGAVIFVWDALGGLDYALTNQFRYGIRIVNNSWGSTASFDPNHPIVQASKRLHDRNIVVVFAAGNEGPGEATMNPYAIAPWVIGVGAGNKSGQLANFSSRGARDGDITFTQGGETWTARNRPTIVGPGVDVISARASTNLTANGLDEDLVIEPAYLPFYTMISGTSMSTPHVAGIVALMLEANSTLSPGDVKHILEQTATNMPGRASWEVGAGYVNAYAAVAMAYGMRTDFGPTVNQFRSFHASASMTATEQPVTINYSPVPVGDQNRHEFQVGEGYAELTARVDVHGLLGETGNTVNLVLIAPDGTEYSSGIYVAFTLYRDRVVSVPSPRNGTWTMELRGLRGDELNPTDGLALPENVNGKITLRKASGFTGLNDIANHPAEGAIQAAISNRLMDGYANGNFGPDDALTRIQMADYLVTGAGVRQFLPLAGGKTFGDVSGVNLHFAEAVAARGAALRDRAHQFRGVMLPAQDGRFRPSRAVSRTELAYSLVQSLGLEPQALERNGKAVTVHYNGQRVPVTDADKIPSGMEGYVQLALDLNMLNAYFSIHQGPFDLFPTVTATFRPSETVTRGAYAVAITRWYNAHVDGFTVPAPSQSQQESQQIAAGNAEIEQPEAIVLNQNYPNPFNPSTTISFTIPEDAAVTLAVYNVQGQRVATLVSNQKSAGTHSVQWNGRSDGGESVASGIYLYRLEAGSFVETKSMMLLK